jgi:hypothetical protein
MGSCCSTGGPPDSGEPCIGPVPDNNYEEAQVDPTIIMENSQLFDVEGHAVFVNGSDNGEFVMIPPTDVAGTTVSVAVARDEDDPELHFVDND